MCWCLLLPQAPALSSAKAPTSLSSPQSSVRPLGRAASQTPLTTRSPWPSPQQQTALWGSTRCMLPWWHLMASAGPGRKAPGTCTSSSIPGWQVCCVVFFFYVYVFESLNCNIPVWLSSYSSTPQVVFPQRMLCSWMMRQRGRSVWWPRWGSSITAPMMTLLRGTGTMDR